MEISEFPNEQPLNIGKKPNSMMSEYPEGFDPNAAQPPAPLQDLGPLPDRIKHKLFAKRKVAFEELAEKLKNDEIDLNEYKEWEKYIADANIGAQEKAVSALVIYLGKIDKDQAEKLNFTQIFKILIDKCISPGKIQIKKPAFESFVLLYEKLFKAHKQEIFDIITANMSSKNQKIVVSSITCITELLTNFGPKNLDYL